MYILTIITKKITVYRCMVEGLGGVHGTIDGIEWAHFPDIVWKES